MPKYWVTNYLAHGRFPEVGQKQSSSSYVKILGEKLFHTWEIPRSGSKAEDGERKKKKRERKKERKLGITMAKLRMAHASTHGARKPPGPKF